MPIRVTIFDDNKKILDSLSVLIDGTEGFVAVAAYADAKDVVAKVSRSHPDVVLMDIDMPGVDGIAAVRELKTEFPNLAIMMQTVFEDDDKIFHSLCNGASGYMLKNTPPARMLEAIEDVYHGGSPMSPPIARKVVAMLQQKENSLPVVRDKSDTKLSPREKEVLALMVQGLSYKMMAAQLDISFETVRTHIRHIYEKLHVATMSEAVAKAIKQKIV
jgi:DNA-binding NarL/FixJ family response regulator